MDETLQSQITNILREVDALHEQHQSQQEQDRTTQPPAPIIVYLVDAPPSAESEEERIVESSVESSGRAGTPDTEQETAPITQHPAATRSRKRSLALASSLLCLLIALAVSAVYLVPLFTASANVTLMPTETEITTTTTISIVPGTPTAAQQIPGRSLSALTLTQARTVPTTGQGRQTAQAGHGLVTFYNAGLSVQIVPAGTLLVGADGVQVVTDQDAVLPAGTLATNGHTTVLAHATISGPGGNIAAGDIYGGCCRINVFASNGPFVGGQDARDFPMVTQQDINGAAAALKSSLAQSVNAAYRVQLHDTETLVTPVPCTPHITTDHQAGDEARTVHVTVEETCMGIAYETQAMHDLIAQITTAQAARQLGAGYSLSEDVQQSVVGSSQNHNVIALQVKGVGICTYQFSQGQIEQIKGMIAGKSRDEATQLLLHLQGVRTVSMHIAGANTAALPANSNAINVLILY